MNFFDTVQELLGTSRFVMSTYLSDMSDADILVRPVAGAHHAAWQIGHLIVSERRMIEGISPQSCPALPTGFEAGHAKESEGREGALFLPIKEYQDLMTAQRRATIEVAKGVREPQLMEPAPEFMRSYAPFVRSVFLSIGGHELMHAGQIAVIRRALGKPVLI
jgi:hypothetical protein